MTINTRKEEYKNMSKNKIISLILLIIALCAGIIIYFITSSSSVGTISRNYAEPTEISSTVSFQGGKDELVSFKLTSKITHGELQFIVIDSEGNILSTFNQDNTEHKLTLEKEDEYTVIAQSDGLVGKFKLQIYLK